MQIIILFHYLKKHNLTENNIKFRFGIKTKCNKLINFSLQREQIKNEEMNKSIKLLAAIVKTAIS